MQRPGRRLRYALPKQGGRTICLLCAHAVHNTGATASDPRARQKKDWQRDCRPGRATAAAAHTSANRPVLVGLQLD